MKIFKGLRGKLILLAGLPVVGLMVAAFIAINGIRSLEKVINGLSQKRIPITQLIGDVRIHSNAVSRLIWQNIASNSTQAQSKVDEHIYKRISDLEKCLNELENIGLVEENKRNLQKLKDQWSNQKQKYLSLLSGFSRLNNIELQHKMIETIESSNQMTEVLLAMGTVMVNTNKKTTEQADELTSQVKMIMVLCAIMFSIVSLLWVLFLNKQISKQFTKISDDLGLAGTQVASASEEMSKSSHMLSSSSIEGAASLEQTVASLDEINTQISLNTERTSMAQSLGFSAKQLSQSGESQIKNLLNSINEIDKSSKQIQDIIGIIDDIAFQTNLLSLNAAVEAARAGDQGKGFAVVADAVRNLSQRTANSAKEISKLISESSEKTVSGVNLASSSHQVLKEVFQVIAKLATLNDEIAVSSKEQSISLQQISIAISQLDTTTQSNAAAAEETSSTAEELSAQSRELHKLVNHLVQVVHGEVDKEFSIDLKTA